MARTSAISILSAPATAATLKEIYGIVIENVKKDTLSGLLKSQLYTGDPMTGSVAFKRFVNSQAKDYGTARTAGHGDKITAPETVCNLSVHKEIVEECAKFDLDTFGIADIMRRRAINHIDTMSSALDTAFFAAAGTAATAATITETAEIDQLEEVTQVLESVKNDYVDGVPRNMIAAVCTPAFYGKIRKALDALPASKTDSAAEEFGLYHGLKVWSGIHLPTGVDAIIMAVGSVGQPVVTYPYGDPEKIPLSNDFASTMFFDYGTTAIMSDLIFKINTPAG